MEMSALGSFCTSLSPMLQIVGEFLLIFKIVIPIILIVICHIQRRVNWWKYFNPNCGRKEFADWVSRYLVEWSNVAFLVYEERIFDMLATKDAKKLMKLLHIKED